MIVLPNIYIVFQRILNYHLPSMSRPPGENAMFNSSLLPITPLRYRLTCPLVTVYNLEKAVLGLSHGSCRRVGICFLALLWTFSIVKKFPHLYCYPDMVFHSFIVSQFNSKCITSYLLISGCSSAFNWQPGHHAVSTIVCSCQSPGCC